MKPRNPKIAAFKPLFAISPIQGVKAVKRVALFLVAFLVTCLTVTGQEKEGAEFSELFWSKARDAGYLDGKAVTDTRHVELLAKALPESPLITLMTKEDWDGFIERFAKVDKETRKPLLVSGTGAVEKTGFVPDFGSEALLVLISKKSQRIGDNGSGFMDIEVFENEGRLRAYAFFRSWDGNLDPPPKTFNEPVQGHFYMVTIPRKLAQHSVEFRIAHQSWGRECSRFSPPITKSDAVEIPQKTD